MRKTLWNIAGVACRGRQWENCRSSTINISFEVEGGKKEAAIIAIEKLKKWAKEALGRDVLLKAVTLSRGNIICFLRSRETENNFFSTDDDMLFFL